MWTDQHLKWLQDTGEVVTTVCGKQAPIYQFAYDIDDVDVMAAWALHFRKHYCSDFELEILKPEDKSNSEYLLEVKFPSKTEAPGSSVRAGDFAEILVADYLQFLKGYCVPRTRYDRKIVANESSKGSDVIAFKQNASKPSKRDELLIYEVKAKLSEKKIVNVLQDAINHSAKDELRIAESLNAMKQRLYDRNDEAGVSMVGRFQKNVDAPYDRSYGAAAVLTETSFCSETLSEADSAEHPNTNKLELLVISGEKLMLLVHELYERAANGT